MVAPGSVVLTACVKLLVSEETEKKLERTRLAFRDACNFLVPFVREDPKKRNWQRFNLHHAAYEKLKQAFPELGAQLRCNAMRCVSSAYKTELSNHPRKTPDEPLREIKFRNPSIHLDKNTITYCGNGLTATVRTVAKRVQVTLCPGPHQQKLLRLGRVRESNLVWHSAIYLRCSVIVLSIVNSSVTTNLGWKSLPNNSLLNRAYLPPIT